MVDLLSYEGFDSYRLLIADARTFDRWQIANTSSTYWIGQSSGRLRITSLLLLCLRRIWKDWWIGISDGPNKFTSCINRLRQCFLQWSYSCFCSNLKTFRLLWSNTYRFVHLPRHDSELKSGNSETFVFLFKLCIDHPPCVINNCF